jgi:hypothetical protein
LGYFNPGNADVLNAQKEVHLQYQKRNWLLAGKPDEKEVLPRTGGIWLMNLPTNIPNLLAVRAEEGEYRQDRPAYAYWSEYACI